MPSRADDTGANYDAHHTKWKSFEATPVVWLDVTSDKQERSPTRGALALLLAGLGRHPLPILDQPTLMPQLGAELDTDDPAPDRSETSHVPHACRAAVID